LVEKELPEMNYLKYLAIVAAMALLTPLSLFAADTTTRSVTIGDPVTVGTTHLKPGHYKVEWQGTGPAVQVNFVRNGKTVATAPAKLQTNDSQIKQDDIVMDRTSAQHQKLKEIDFSHQKEALMFGQNGM
jgi:hypothetical protein